VYSAAVDRAAVPSTGWRRHGDTATVRLDKLLDG